MDEAYFQQFKKNIESLVVEGRLEEAFQLCTNTLQKHPENKIFLGMEKSIAKQLLDKNKKKVKEGYKEAKKLKKEGKKEDSLRKVRDMLKLAPNNAKLKKFFIKVQKEYKEDLEKAEAKFIKQKEDEFQKDMDNNETSQLIQKLETLDIEYRENKNIRELVKKTKTKLVDNIIREKSELLNSTKFKDIRNLLSNLKNIDKNSKTIAILEESVRRKAMGEHIGNIEEFIYTSKHDLETLMKMKKYPEAVIVSLEILKTHPGNQEVRKVHKKAKRRAYTRSRKDIAKRIKGILPKLTAEYQQNKQNFIKI